jgi:folylpolyglutamate synthase/dihydropteroate synthase
MTIKKTTSIFARREAADETTSSGRLTALAEESTLARIVAKNPSAPVSLLRALSRSEDEATRKAVVTNPRAPYDVLSYLENQFPELFVNDPALGLYNSLKI